jgi:hypothetical protein
LSSSEVRKLDQVGLVDGQHKRLVCKQQADAAQKACLLMMSKK